MEGLIGTYKHIALGDIGGIGYSIVPGVSWTSPPAVTDIVAIGEKILPTVRGLSVGSGTLDYLRVTENGKLRVEYVFSETSKFILNAIAHSASYIATQHLVEKPPSWKHCFMEFLKIWVESQIPLFDNGQVYPGHFDSITKEWFQIVNTGPREKINPIERFGFNVPNVEFITYKIRTEGKISSERVINELELMIHHAMAIRPVFQKRMEILTEVLPAH